MGKWAAVLIALLAAAPAQGQSIEGRWKLIAAEDLRADGTVARYPWGRNPVGSIVVDGGSCYVQIMSGDVYVGTQQTRFFRFEGNNKMFFGPAPSSIRAEGGNLTRRLTLERQ